MKYLIVGNWKCNPLKLAEAKRIFNPLKKRVKNSKKVEVVICPPFVYLGFLKSERSKIKLGAQDCFWEEKGPFTGEVSPKMLKGLGCQYVIVGHSERRRYLKETDEMINKKLKAVLKAGMKPILCIDNLTQLKRDLRGIKEGVIVAYEPIFAIGTGKPCPLKKAKEMRELIKYPFVLYGGSVNSQNATLYLEKANFQGLLIGGASLSPKEFLKIIKGVERRKGIQ